MTTPDHASSDEAGHDAAGPQPAATRPAWLTDQGTQTPPAEPAAAHAPLPEEGAASAEPHQAVPGAYGAAPQESPQQAPEQAPQQGGTQEPAPRPAPQHAPQQGATPAPTEHTAAPTPAPAADGPRHAASPPDPMEDTAVRRQSLFGRSAASPDQTTAVPAGTQPAQQSPQDQPAQQSPQDHSAPAGQDQPAPAGPAPQETRTEEAPTQPVPQGSYAGGPPSLQGRWSPPTTSPADSGDLVLEGATQAGPPSRAAARWWSLAIALLLSPVAWYLVADGGARAGTTGTGLIQGDAEVTAINPAALVELGAGLLLVVVILMAARWSALGHLIAGAAGLAAGGVFLAIPAQAWEAIGPVTSWLQDWNAFGNNLVHHLGNDGVSGRLALYGLVLLVTGLATIGARRSGRAEQRRREAFERSTGGTLPADRSARHRG